MLWSRLRRVSISTFEVSEPQLLSCVEFLGWAVPINGTSNNTMAHTQELDLEKSSANSYVRLDGAADVPVEYAHGDTWYARAQRWAEKHNMEQRSIDRVPEDERNDTSLLNVCTMVSSRMS